MPRIRPALTAILAALALTACTKDANDPVERAKLSQARGDLAAAIVDLKAAIQKSPEDARIRFQLGQVYNQAFDGFSAEKELIKAEQLGLVEGGRVQAALARALWLQGNHRALVERIDPSDKFEPLHLAEVQAYRGQALAALGQVEEATKSLAHAKALQGAQAVPVVELLDANIHASRGQVKAALSIIARVLEKQPGFYDALALRADIVALTGEPDAAIAAYGELLKVHPTHLVGLLGRSNVYLRLGKFDDAERDVQAIRKAYKDNFIGYFQEGLLQFRKGQFRTALASFQQALKRNPGFESAQLYEAMAQLFLGNAQSAQRSLNQYVTSRPNDLLGRRMLASALMQLNDNARALEVLTPVLQARESPVEFWKLAAEVHARLGELEKAMDWLRKVEEARPDDPSIQQRQATLNLQRGRADLAMADFADAARLSKTITSADTMLVLLNLQQRKFDAAMAAANKMLEKSPDAAFPANLKGVILMEQGRYKEASGVFEEVLRKSPAFLPAASNLARLDLINGKPDQVKKRFESVLAADKNQVQAMFVLADIERRQGRPNEALALLERAANAAPSAFEPRKRLVELLLSQRNVQAARDHAQEAVTRNPNNVSALELLGNVQLAIGDKLTAVATFSRITEMAPKSPEAQVARAQAERAAGMTRDAEASLRRALELQSGFAPAQGMLFEMLMQQKRESQAAALAKQIMSESPKSPLGYVFEAEIAAQKKLYKQAVSLYRKALDLGQTPDLAVRLYFAQRLAGEKKEALDELRKWVAKHPTHIETRAEFGRALLESGDAAGAVRQFEILLGLAPANAKIANHLAWSHYKNRNLTQALRFAQGAHQLAPDDPYAADTLGWLLLQQGKVKEALELLTKAVAALKDSPVVRYHYAAALAKSGDKERARTELNVALSHKQPFEEREEAAALMAQMR